MSKIALASSASGTGTITVAAPSSNTDRTLTLPDNTGTLLSTAQLVNDLVTGGINKALTAEQGKVLFNMFVGSTTFDSAGDIKMYIPNASVPSKPWIIQIGTRVSIPSYVANTEVVATLPVTYPNTHLFILAVNGDVTAQTNSVIGVSQYKTNSAFGWRCNSGGAARMNYLSIGN